MKAQHTTNEKPVINLSCSGIYDRRHGITDADQRKAQSIIEVINGRDHTMPQAGDIIWCSNPQTGKLYVKGHLEKAPHIVMLQLKSALKEVTDALSNICVRPSTPFVFINGSGDNIRYDTEGDYWLTCKDTKELKRAGEETKIFKTWGHCGATADGAFYFEASVSVWLYENNDVY